MYCRVCGARSAEVAYRPAQRQVLCTPCYRTTPAKISRAAFDRAYWGAERDSVPESVRREFYADYLTSNDGFRAYVKATTEVLA